MKLLIADDDVPIGNNFIENLLKENGRNEDHGRVKIGNDYPAVKKPDRTLLERELIALDALEGKLTQSELAKVHNTTQGDISDLMNGKRSDGKTHTDIKEVVDNARSRIIDSATDKLLKTLDNFNPDAIEQKNLTSNAAQLASIVERISGRDKNNSINNVQLIFHSPRQKVESDYISIEVG